MKKIFAIALIAVMSLVVVACKKGDAQAPATNVEKVAEKVVDVKADTNKTEVNKDEAGK
jgi:outer membrane lipoprotein-sorting protein